MPAAEFKYDVAVQCCSRYWAAEVYTDCKIYVVYCVGIVNAQIDLTEVSALKWIVSEVNASGRVCIPCSSVEELIVGYGC